MTYRIFLTPKNLNHAPYFSNEGKVFEHKHNANAIINRLNKTGLFSKIKLVEL